MKAAVYSQYGTPEVVKIQEATKPLPKDNEILVKVHTTTVTSGDWRMRAGDPFAIRLYNGLFAPKRTILGHEFSGVVDSVGKDVTHCKSGDPVFGLAGGEAGAHAEYVVVPADGTVAPKPASISDATAAALPNGAMTALFFLKQANIQPGQKVLINGASGSVGTYAVQLAKYFGAEVTAVCSTRNVELVRSLGADNVIDYTQYDFTNNPEQYHVIFDAVGKASYNKSKKVLRKQGIFLTVAMSIPLLLQSVVASWVGKKKLITAIAKMTPEDLRFVIQLVEKGQLRVVVDRRYSFSDISNAHEHAQTGHKIGNLVLELAS